MSQKPNIVLINCDDLGYGDLSCFGSTTNDTPALDRMAADGMIFTDFTMASPVCSPSRAALLTGCFPTRVGFGTFEGEWVLFPGQPVGLNPSEKTIACFLREAGYATCAVGKWHCGDQRAFLPTNHGFDEYYGLPYSNDMGIQKGAANFPPLPLVENLEVLQAQPDQTSLLERYVEKSVRFIRANATRPFFLYLAHMFVHLPLYVPDAFVRQSRNGRYGAAVSALDWSTSVLLQEIKNLGLDETTIVIFTSDNGSRARGEGGSNGILRGTKGTSYEGGHRVPFIARWPGHIPAESRCDQSINGVDILPTLVGLAGGKMPSDRKIDGLDIGPILKGQPGAKVDRSFTPYYLRDDLQAIRVGNWKLHIRHDGVPVQELYNLADDPGESINLYDSHPEQVAQLSEKASECRMDLGDKSEKVHGRGVRPIGRVDHAEYIIPYDQEYPYIVPMYDLEERG